MFLRPCLRPVSLSAGRPVVLSSLLLALVLALSGCAKKEAAPEPLRAVRTIKVESGSVAALQEFSGEVKARTETRISRVVALNSSFLAMSTLFFLRS